MSTHEKEATDVLIVGAGVAGMMLALELAAQGTAFRIVDKVFKRSEKSRALIVQPRSFEVMNRHGEARRLYEKGSETSGPMVWMNGKPVLDVNLSSVANYKDSEFALPCLLSQADTEAYLAHCLKERYGVEVERGCSVLEIVQDTCGVSTTLRNGNGDTAETIRTKYVVGADGAHSAVRKSSPRWTFAGDTYPQEFVLCDATMEDFRLPKDRYHLILKNGLFAVFPMAGGWVRIMASRSKHTGIAPTVDEINAMLSKTLPDSGKITKATWLSNFRLHHRVANSYRDGRLFLIGDAAHVHSPVGGQGLNTALQDALNLGWKLARVIRGASPDGLLDTYDAERRRVGQELIAKTDRIFNLVSATNPVAVSLRGWILPWVAPYITSASGLRNIYHFMSQFGVHYRASPLAHRAAGSDDGPVKPGDRAPDGDVEIGGRGGGETTRLHKILAPASFHFVLFSGSARDGTERHIMADIAARFERTNPDGARVHIIVQERSGGGGGGGGDGEEQQQQKKRIYSHRLHGTYGFSGPGYVYIRPDGYVAAIGRPEHLDDFLSWLATPTTVTGQDSRADDDRVSIR